MPIINMVYKKKKWWKPWANTIAYYPLTSTTTVNDLSGNGYTLTQNTWVTFQNNQWVSSARIYGTDGSWFSFWLTQSSLSTAAIWTVFTLNYYWLAEWYIRAWSSIRVWWWKWFNASLFWVWVGNNNANAEMLNSSIGTIGSSEKITNNIRYNLCFTYNNWQEKLYLNGVEVASWTYTIASSSDTIFWIGVSFGRDNYYASRWCASNVILENKARTAQEVADYYNSTKANYWL